VQDRQARLPAFRTSLDPLRRTVERQHFISGKTPAYADYIVFGAFRWARAISDFEVLAGQMIRSGSGAAACSTCSTASLVAPTATERALEYMRAAAGLARPWHD
jgi:hypothetical protein